MIVENKDKYDELEESLYGENKEEQIEKMWDHYKQSTGRAKKEKSNEQ